MRFFLDRHSSFPEDKEDEGPQLNLMSREVLDGLASFLAEYAVIFRLNLKFSNYICLRPNNSGFGLVRVPAHCKSPSVPCNNV